MRADLSPDTQRLCSQLSEHYHLILSILRSWGFDDASFAQAGLHPDQYFVFP